VSKTAPAPLARSVHAPLRRSLDRWLTHAHAARLDRESVIALFTLALQDAYGSEDSHAAVLETIALSKRFGKVDALRDCDVALPREGDGSRRPQRRWKTTLLQLAVGLRRASSGQSASSVSIRRPTQ